MNLTQNIKVRQQIFTQRVKTFADNHRLILRNVVPDYYYAPFFFRVDFSPKRTSHIGGMYTKGPGINIAGHALESYTVWYEDTSFLFDEYASYAKDPIIGSAYTNNLDQYIELSVAHEVAHSIQAYIKNRDLLDNVTPHGALFRKYYEILRLEINKKLPDQQFAAQKYNKKRELYEI